MQSVPWSYGLAEVVAQEFGKFVFGVLGPVRPFVGSSASCSSFEVSRKIGKSVLALSLCCTRHGIIRHPNPTSLLETLNTGKILKGYVSESGRRLTQHNTNLVLGSHEDECHSVSLTFTNYRNITSGTLTVTRHYRSSPITFCVLTTGPQCT